MKKTTIFSSALVALAMLASCQKEELFETPATTTGVTEFTATIEQQTRTAIASDGKVTWVTGDEITVTDAARKSAIYVAESAGATTTFTLKSGQTPVGDGPYTATYGDIAKQVYDAAGANCPLAAPQTSTTNLTFSSPYAVVKITAKSENGEEIKSVSVTYGENKSGLDCGNGVTLSAEGKDFYVAVIPATDVALSVTFYTDKKMATKKRKSAVTLAKNDLLPVTLSFIADDWGDAPVAKVGETTYLTLAEAIEAVGNNGTVTLIRNVTDAVGIALPSNKGITLDFDGHIYTVGGPGAGTPATAAFEIPQTSTMVFKNGTIRCPEDNKTKTGGISTIIRNNGGLTLKNISIDGTNLAGDGYGTLIVNTNTIEGIDGGTYTNDGPVLVTEPGIVEVGGSGANKVTFTSSNSTAIIVRKSQVTLKDGDYTGAMGVVSFPGSNASEIEIEAGTYNSTDYPVLWGDKNGKNNKVTVEGGTFNATATGNNAPCGIFSPGNDNIIVTGGTFNVPGESTSAAGGTGVTLLNGNLTIEEEQGMPAPKFNVGKTEGTGKVLGIDIKRGYSITVNKNYGNPTVTADSEKYPQGTIEAGALTGVFTVSDDGAGNVKKVYFSQGNLWYGKVGSATTETWNFEPNQYEIQTSWNTSHVSHFYWSKTASVAYAEPYSESGTSGSDVFFTNAEAETAKADFTVNGVTGKYRTLSTDEWTYLFNTRTMANGGAGYENLTSSGITVQGVLFEGVVLFPDDFTEQATWKETYTTWEALNSAGLVFLPAAGGRSGSNVFNVGGDGNYWSSSALYESFAYSVPFNDREVNTDCPSARSYFGFSVRLVMDVPAK